MSRNQSWPRAFLYVVALVVAIYFMYLGVRYMFRTDDAPGPVALSVDAHKAVSYVGPVILVRPNDVIRKPKCKAGTSPAGFFVQEKTTAAGTWTLNEKDADSWVLIFDGVTGQDGIQLATFCQ